MDTVDISKEISVMWGAFKRLSSVVPMLENPEGEINCSILDQVVTATRDSSRVDVVSLSAFGNYLKFMLSSQKDGVLFQPTEQTFRDWYNKTKA
jgi:hypothetical protein